MDASSRSVAETEAESKRRRRPWPELGLAVTACLVFLGFLGSVDLWGKREQRATAEALDTVREGHWLIAEIQSRPRLEKPPLPRWTIAALLAITGRRDEAIVRLPGALSALGMVALVVALARRIGGREVSLAAGMVLASSAFFIVELRQAGNDGPLALFVTLALYAAWRRIEPGAIEAGAGGRRWAWIFALAMGLGFLTKGPVVVLIVGLTIAPYLAITRSLRAGARRLADPWGVLLFLVLATGWPLLVLRDDPRAWEVWSHEMGQKTGVAGLAHLKRRLPLAVEWPLMAAPWGVVAATGLALPFLRQWRAQSPDGLVGNDRPAGDRASKGVWYPWCWAVANLAMLSAWSVAKPSYYLPCLPGVAILAGLGWVGLTRAARDGRARSGAHARRILQAHWVAFFVTAIVAPVIVAQMYPDALAWTLLASAILAAGVVASAIAWRRGADAGSLGPIVAALAMIVALVYGGIAPRLNPRFSHRGLADEIARVVPADGSTILFVSEIDEGLWFYLRDHRLAPVPNTQPLYNKGYEVAEDVRRGANLIWTPPARAEAESRRIVAALALMRSRGESPHVLIREASYVPIARALGPIARVVLLERDLRRNGLVLLKVETPAVAQADAARR